VASSLLQNKVKSLQQKDNMQQIYNTFKIMQHNF